MFVLVDFGWQELKLRYCFESVLLIMEGAEDANIIYRTIQSGWMMKMQSTMTLQILFCQWTDIGLTNYK